MGYPREVVSVAVLEGPAGEDPVLATPTAVPSCASVAAPGAGVTGGWPSLTKSAGAFEQPSLVLQGSVNAGGGVLVLLLTPPPSGALAATRSGWNGLCSASTHTHASRTRMPHIVVVALTLVRTVTC